MSKKGFKDKYGLNALEMFLHRGDDGYSKVVEIFIQYAGEELKDLQYCRCLLDTALFKKQRFSAGVLERHIKTLIQES